jgi:2-keto-4-pentenoate hydratase/2-oxohepta-3-ene-1,7-dioic acid hydratase in catechol pathway
MRWCTYAKSDGHPHAGLIVGGLVHGLDVPVTLIEVIRSAESMQQARNRALAAPIEVLPEADVKLLAPIPVPPSFRDFMAFEEHVVMSTEALGLKVDPTWYELPVFYFSNPAAIIGPYDPVPISPGSAAFDYELEIAAVIGRPGRNILAADADSHIAGYTVLGDWSARDLQEHEMKMHLGPAKGKDGATSIGPVLVTVDELEPYRRGNSYDLAMSATVNGKPYSSGNFSTIYWNFGQLIEHASRGTQLRTGDIIGSGTVGTGCILELARSHGADAFPWLKPGDEVTLTIEHIGEIRTVVVDSRDR